VDVPLAQVGNRLSFALEYAQVARVQFRVKESRATITAAGNAILAGIAAADVLCIVHLRVRSASTNHSDAIALLQEVNHEAAQDLSVLLHEKSPSHYGLAPVDIRTLTRMMRSMERLIHSASAAASDGSPR
jgi:hypothetical protein